MSQFSVRKVTGALFVVCIVTATAARAQTFTTLVNFDLTNGRTPLYGALVQGTDGDLYGATATGGSGDGCGDGAACGTAFRLTLAGDMTTVHDFCSEQSCPDGSTPFGGLLLASDGNLYGTTSEFPDGGTIFEIARGGKLTTLHAFDGADGDTPYAGLIQAANGKFYGTTYFGGTNNRGTVFSISASGTLTTLHNFHVSDGEYPFAGVIQATDGKFYGTASFGGAYGEGTAFRLTSAGGFATVYNFCHDPGCLDGSWPVGGLLLANDGNLYGTTRTGGKNGVGTVFRVAQAGKFTLLHTFDKSDGDSPVGTLIQGTDGNLYGTTIYGGANNDGTIFRITLQGALTKIHDFNGEDGSVPIGTLRQDTNGIFYGTTSAGGIYGEGTIFSLSMGLGPFVTFVRSVAKVGQTGGILGQGFTGTTSVSLNGVPASFKVISDTFIKATVPVGATTGYVTVTTPSGTLTSNVPFRVIP
jgi:uncharacterized repeat protein (TIGR03803 family)